MIGRGIQKTALLLAAMTFILGGVVFAQDMKSAVDLYNSARQGFKSNPKQSIEDVQKSINMLESLDTEPAKDLLKKAKSFLPMAHFQYAGRLYKERKLEETFTEMTKARTAAEEVNDQKTLKTVTNTLAQIYYKEGLGQMESKDFAAAVQLFDKAIETYPKYLTAIVAKAMVQDSLKDYDGMIETVKNGIVIAQQNSDLKREMDMRAMALNHLSAKGQAFQDKNKLDSAIAYFSQAIEIDSRNAEIYSALSNCHVKRKSWDLVLENTAKALEFAPGTMDKTNIYYMSAQAKQATGDVTGACADYKRAAGNPHYRETAEFQMKELKCK